MASNQLRALAQLARTCAIRDASFTPDLDHTLPDDVFLVEAAPHEHRQTAEIQLYELVWHSIWHGAYPLNAWGCFPRWASRPIALPATRVNSLFLTLKQPQEAANAS